MAVKSIQLGQVWRQDASNQDYLVTKLYNEVFSQIAVLRLAETNAPDVATIRVKAVKGADGFTLRDTLSRRKARSNSQYMTERILAILFAFITSVIHAAGYGGLALLMAIESACIPLPSELIMPFAGYLVFQGSKR